MKEGCKHILGNERLKRHFERKINFVKREIEEISMLQKTSGSQILYMISLDKIKRTF